MADSRVQTNINQPYVGRFAPSPTGPLHFGSLLAAVGSYLEARCQQGRWLLRIDDIDQLRVIPGAADKILQQLERYGFMWDGEVMYQSQRLDYYQHALAPLQQQNLVYPCSCSRREIATLSTQRIYLGTCRNGMHKTAQAYAIRARTDNNVITFQDSLQGHFDQRLESEVGDFIVRRKDGIYAYQLAVVVDDAEQGITHIVRGYDLLDSTPRQLYLQRLLGYPKPFYTHLPVIINYRGDKLSKQAGAKRLPEKKPVHALWTALKLLGQVPPETLRQASLQEFWQWALQHWQLNQVPKTASVSY